MKKTVAIVLTLLLLGTTAFAKAKEVQINLVLSNDEAKKMPNQKYKYISQPGGKTKELSVSNEVLLSRPDIQGMIVIKKEDTKMKDLPFIDIVFTKEGTVKLETVTTKHLRKSIAIIFGDKVLSAPYIIYPMAKGHVMISHWSVATDEEAANLIKEVGFTPIFKGQVGKTFSSTK